MNSESIHSGDTNLSNPATPIKFAWFRSQNHNKGDDLFFYLEIQVRLKGRWIVSNDNLFWTEGYKIEYHLDILEPEFSSNNDSGF